MFKIFLPRSKLGKVFNSQATVELQKSSPVLRTFLKPTQTFSKRSFLNSHQARLSSQKTTQNKLLTTNAALIATTLYNENQKEYNIKISEAVTVQNKLTIPILRGPKSQIMCLNFNHSGTILLAGTAQDNQVYLWQLPTETPQIFSAIGKALRVACNQDGTLLAIAYSVYIQGIWQSKIQVININDPTPIDLYDENGNQYFKQNVFSLAFNPKSTLLVSGHDGTGPINSWDINQIEKNKINKAVPIKIIGVKNATQLVFDSTGNKLACGNRHISESEEGIGCTGFIYDLNTHAQIKLEVPEYWSNNCIAFSSDNQFLVTGGQYRKSDNFTYAVVRLWDTKGKWKNQTQLSKSDSPFFGRKGHFTSFVSFNDKNDEDEKILSIDQYGFVRENDLSGKSGKEIGSYGSHVMGFCYQDINVPALDNEPKKSLKSYKPG